MDGPKIWRGHATLSAPLKMMGVERRWFLLSATVALALWNAINSLLIGGMIFGSALHRRPAGLEERPGHAFDPEGLGELPSPLRPGQVEQLPLVCGDPRMNLRRE